MRHQVSWSREVSSLGLYGNFFEKIENILSDQTKFEIAVWLVGIDVERKVHAWPLMFSKLFYKTFGNKLLSWKAVFKLGSGDRLYSDRNGCMESIAGN